jgi:hypothetical protein
MFIPAAFQLSGALQLRRLLNMPDARQRVCPMARVRQFSRRHARNSGDVQPSGLARGSDLLRQKMDVWIKPGNNP